MRNLVGLRQPVRVACDMTREAGFRFDLGIRSDITGLATCLKMIRPR